MELIEALSCAFSDSENFGDYLRVILGFLALPLLRQTIQPRHLQYLYHPNHLLLCYNLTLLVVASTVVANNFSVANFVDHLGKIGASCSRESTQNVPRL